MGKLKSIFLSLHGRALKVSCIVHARRIKNKHFFYVMIKAKVNER
jgi:hypothetical protein